MADTQATDGHTPSGAAHWIAENETFVTPHGHEIAYRQRGQGPAVLMLQGFPTWSYDYVAVAAALAADHTVITLDFLGYGASDKPNPYEYSVAESADIVEQLVSHLGLDQINLVVHDYGGIVGQELLDRRRHAALPFDLGSVTILNCGIVYSEYRPTEVQKQLIDPELGPVLAGLVTGAHVRSLIDGVRGESKLTDDEFDNLWQGISRNDGHKIFHLLIRYNAERELHHGRWEAALQAWDRPLSLVWGLQDPVSGRRVLERARELLPNADVTALENAGHFPQAEAPIAVAAAIRNTVVRGRSVS